MKAKAEGAEEAAEGEVTGAMAVAVAGEVRA
jgi:hypothetical protein